MKSAGAVICRVSALAILSNASIARAQEIDVLDVLLVNGRVLDGAGNPWMRQDVGLRGDRIAWLGLASRDRPQARDTVDIRGLYVAPGFIDMHSHADFDTD